MPHTAAARSLYAASIFAKQTTARLRQLACTMDHLRFLEGEPIFRQGDVPDGVYILDEGFCSVEVEGLGTVTMLSDVGTLFGEMALFMHDDRSATIRAQSEVRCLRVRTKDVLGILEDAWGTLEEMEDRAE